MPGHSYDVQHKKVSSMKGKRLRTKRHAEVDTTNNQQ
jgi:hypothetical protein